MAKLLMSNAPDELNIPVSPQIIQDNIRIRNPKIAPVLKVNEYIKEYKTPNPSYVIGTIMIIGAACLVVGTIVEDIYTAGVGIADDVPSFAAAGAMVSEGVALYSAVAVTTVVLTK